jgi:hypothetical protein
MRHSPSRPHDRRIWPDNALAAVRFCRANAVASRRVTIVQLVDDCGVPLERDEAVRKAAEDRKLLAARALSIAATQSPNVGGFARTSTTTSHIAPTKQRASLAWPCGSAWKRRPRNMPIDRDGRRLSRTDTVSMLA